MSFDAATQLAQTNIQAGDDVPPLAITVHSTERSLRVEVSGELDLNTVPLLQQALETALAPLPERLFLDFRHLEFIDSAGLALLVDLHPRFRGHHHPSSLTLLVPVEGQVREVLELSHFGQFFHIEYGDQGT